MSGTMWDMFNWYNWWWLPSDDNDEEKEDEKVDLKQTEPEPAPEIIEPVQKEPTVIEQTVAPGSLQLTLSPSTLDELKHEADELDFSIEQLIESILEEYLESKRDEEPDESESWKCTYCKPEIEFFDYFEYSNHFFEKHIQPNLQKISNKHAHF